MKKISIIKTAVLSSFILTGSAFAQSMPQNFPVGNIDQPSVDDFARNDMQYQNDEQNAFQTPGLTGSWPQQQPQGDEINDMGNISNNEGNAQGSPINAQMIGQDQSMAQPTTRPTRPPMSDNDMERLLWSYDPKQIDRQNAVKNRQPNSIGIAHSDNYEDKLRLEEWTRHLKNIGVNEDKIMFEARRLNRADFEMWASRFVWWEQKKHPNIIDLKK